MQAGDPRADPTVVDLIELAGLWLAAGDRPALSRTLARLDRELTQRFPSDADFAERFRALRRQIASSDAAVASDDELRRAYRRATVG